MYILKVARVNRIMRIDLLLKINSLPFVQHGLVLQFLLERLVLHIQNAPSVEGNMNKKLLLCLS